jgi:hypothetical protein
MDGGHFPDDAVIHGFIVMPEDIADSGDLTPWDLRITGLDVVGQVSGGFGHNLDATLDRARHVIHVDERLKTYTGDGFQGAVYGADDVIQPQPD